MLFFTKTALGNLLRKYSTRMYPHVVREPFKDARGELYNEIDKCIFCMKCSKVCPSQCITVDNKAATWECDPFACVYCGVCVENCPVSCLHMKPAYRKAVYDREMIHMQGELKKKKAASAQKTAPELATAANPDDLGESPE
ncbi:4Fe-4S binding protein [Desulfocurvibacter africanus]|uniref:4Fe-4S ferredoxin iron-sulfur binding domain-containing protein n=2 Tax=Desulfocurvibacter africanus TaxID=873 RepID=F3YVX5_DESAF|nr:4Fe-4S binding protein [Desulfocurvibacter africanus]EGJ48933.1 4Fe-4S ferredoxin iron-sulfur binding domain-containing protein [Desulfocurvibacter africanus subsp. africanus str. Walvis Bay]EMG37262.1 ech hydrogenase subunit F [Desulfocurvibacter africanus PCS]